LGIRRRNFSQSVVSPRSGKRTANNFFYNRHLLVFLITLAFRTILVHYNNNAAYYSHSVTHGIFSIRETIHHIKRFGKVYTIVTLICNLFVILLKLFILGPIVVSAIHVYYSLCIIGWNSIYSDCNHCIYFYTVLFTGVVIVLVNKRRNKFVYNFYRQTNTCSLITYV